VAPVKKLLFQVLKAVIKFRVGKDPLGTPFPACLFVRSPLTSDGGNAQLQIVIMRKVFVMSDANYVCIAS
jgi:hypothetical protein